MSTSTDNTAQANVTATDKVDADDSFAAQPMTCEYKVEKHDDGKVRVKDVPIFGENDRSSFLADAKYDAKWLKVAHKVDQKLRDGKYSAPMHFGHHTFAGGQPERAGHYELTGVRKVSLHGKKTHVAFADLVFKNQATFERYLADYPYRSVEISHERPDQINSLALLSAEAPYFQFPIGEHKFATEVGPGDAPKAHYFTWQAPVTETFAGFPLKKKTAKPAKASQPPRYGEEEAAPGESDGADGMAAAEEGAEGGAPAAPAEQGTNQNDVVVATLGAMMELLNKLVDHTIKKDDGHPEPDGDEPEGEDADQHDGDEDMSEKTEKAPVVAASADVAAMQGKIVALEAELTRMRKDRENDAKFASLKTELTPYGIKDLDALLKAQIESGTADAWASGIKSLAPSPRSHEAPSLPQEDPAVAKFVQENPKVDPVRVRELAAVYAAAPAGHLVRKHSLERFLQAQIEMGN